MRMPRMRVRTLLLVVAAVAIALACTQWFDSVTRRVTNYRELEAVHARVSADAASRSDRKLAAHHDWLRRKYARAARYPWLPLAPDPPPAR